MLIGEKVDLVAADRAYVPFYTKWINDPEVTQWLKVDPPMSQEMEQGWVDGIQKEGRMVFTILTKDGRPIGNTGIEEISWRYRRASIGIMIGEKDHWNRGYGSDAVNTLLRYCFEELGMRRVELITDSDNHRAQKAYAKCGFKVEGVMRQYRTKNGRLVDDVMMAILSTDWFGLHPPKTPEE
ncbi:MAG: putative acetyltransferase YhhY [Methanomassiliicoccales archaeon PtaB.Bin134]|nr:MAG: putative acetyltransferase YhhY [Methanomassiliicoccales archaeon PtaB.Bin134]